MSTDDLFLPGLLLLCNTHLLLSVQDSNLGQNLAVLRGHGGPINLIAFHPTLSLALLSASSDGTVRLWDASDPHFPPLVLRSAGAAAAAGPTGAEGGPAGGRADEGPGLASPRAVAAAAAAGAAANAGRGTGARVAAGLQESSVVEVGSSATRSVT